jgi:hypothetical protein
MFAAQVALNKHFVPINFLAVIAFERILTLKWNFPAYIIYGCQCISLFQDKQ